MSLEPSEIDPTQAIIGELFPKVLANHVSKLPVFEALQYSDILAMVGDQELTLTDRLHNVAQAAGQAGLTDMLSHEATILQLCAEGRESEVSDEQRQVAYAKSDANQASDVASNKNLGYYLANGIEVSFEPDAREAAREFCDLDTRDVPLIEKLKAKRLVTINGFGDSRIMYAVHDLIDHAWLFDQMREAGIMEQYDDFLGAIEMGENTFLYSRQAELLASVGFGNRRWEVARTQNEDLILDTRKVSTILTSYDDARTAHANNTLHSMSPAQRRQAIFMIENMAVQFADERRRWGAIKRVNEHGDRRPIDLFDPLHIAIMIDTLSMLQRSHVYGSVQLQATVEVNTMLEAAIQDRSSDDKILIPVPRINPGDVVRLDDKNADWIRRHRSVSTSYNRIG